MLRDNGTLTPVSSLHSLRPTPQGKDVFASAGADGSVRMFDLRSLEHSTIIYESPKLPGSSGKLAPLLRLSWNKQDPKYLATVQASSDKTVILDIRVPSFPVATLGGHGGSVNAVAWAPHSSCHVCTAGEDDHALIWDLSAMPRAIEVRTERSRGWWWEVEVEVVL